MLQLLSGQYMHMVNTSLPAQPLSGSSWWEMWVDVSVGVNFQVRELCSQSNGSPFLGRSTDVWLIHHEDLSPWSVVSYLRSLLLEYQELAVVVTRLASERRPSLLSLFSKWCKVHWAPIGALFMSPLDRKRLTKGARWLTFTKQVIFISDGRSLGGTEEESSIKVFQGFSDFHIKALNW